MAEGGYYEKGFTAKSEIPGIEYKGEGKPGWLEGHNSSPGFKKVDFEADGAGSAGPKAK